MNPPMSDSFESICQKHREFLRRAARQMGVPDQEVDDLIQDTFLIAHRRMSCFEQRSGIGTWLYSILRNVVRNRRRGWRRYERKLSIYSTLVEDTMPCPSEQLLASRALQAFLAHLDPPRRDVFALAALGCTGREIGERLDINQNTAVARLRSARRELAQWSALAP